MAVALERIRPRLPVAALCGLFALATALGVLAREWDWPASLLGRHGAALDARIGVLASVTLNNLPAAALLAAQPPAHPPALLIGLNLGPNLLVTGSLSSLLWYRAARSAGARPSLSRLGHGRRAGSSGRGCDRAGVEDGREHCRSRVTRG